MLVPRPEAGYHHIKMGSCQCGENNVHHPRRHLQIQSNAVRFHWSASDFSAADGPGNGRSQPGNLLIYLDDFIVFSLEVSENLRRPSYI